MYGRGESFDGVGKTSSPEQEAINRSPGRHLSDKDRMQIATQTGFEEIMVALVNISLDCTNEAKTRIASATLYFEMWKRRTENV